jgi:hypothetical protein
MEYTDDDICLRPLSLAVREPTRSVPGLGEFTETIDSNSLRPDDTNDEVDEDDDDVEIVIACEPSRAGDEVDAFVEEPPPNPFYPSFVPECSACNPLSFRRIYATVLTTSAKRQCHTRRRRWLTTPVRGEDKRSYKTACGG